MSEIMLARQPIFDAHSNTVAYEILYRSVDSQLQCASRLGDVELTAQVLSNVLNEMGMASLSEQHELFFNISRDFLLSDYPSLLPAGQSVLEVLEDVEVDTNVIEAIQAWKNKGYTIALDDFVSIANDQARLIRYADIVKVDLLALPEGHLEPMVKSLRQYPVKLLAEKVETQEMYEQCKALGFDYFQGYFICKPKLMVSKSLPSNKLQVLQLLDRTLRAESTTELQFDITHDLALSYKLLKYINSAALGLRTRIDSIPHALNMLGIKNIRLWLSIILLSSFSQDKPPELMIIALSRGRFLELWAEKYGSATLKNDYFVLGMFSTLDALLDQDLYAITDNMSLPASVSRGLFDLDSCEASALELICAIELAAWDDVARLAQHLDTPENQLSALYVESTAWADARLKALM
ncbi:EAL domain-containing protein [Mariprofundus erugo]|uniref:EAL domain-containing protein n=1 Tax=Mariprofundus erugo TaxID=2528639 RepID=A0A5R9GQN1_9PROT|nr:EAL domain-containing protein [Mariprofundus erugo]TLS66272.1 EAL domain-containing protein [Mariprofundus erugo]